MHLLMLLGDAVQQLVWPYGMAPSECLGVHVRPNSTIIMEWQKHGLVGVCMEAVGTVKRVLCVAYVRQLAAASMCSGSKNISRQARPR